MGWSCNRDAAITLDLITERCVAETGQSNCFLVGEQKYMFEVGREQGDGAICATVWKFQPDGRIKPTTSLRIEGDGKISRGLATLKKTRVLVLEIDRRREAWRAEFGEPTEDNVRIQLQVLNDSYKPDGINSHVVVNGGTKVVSEARIVDLEGKVVAEYKHAMFQVV